MVSLTSKLSRILWVKKVHYCFHQILQLGPNLSHKDLFYNCISHLFKICFVSNLHSALWYPKHSPLFTSSN